MAAAQLARDQLIVGPTFKLLRGHTHGGVLYVRSPISRPIHRYRLNSNRLLAMPYGFYFIYLFVLLLFESSTTRKAYKTALSLVQHLGIMRFSR